MGRGQRQGSFSLAAAVVYQSCNAVSGGQRTHARADAPQAMLDCMQGIPCQITAARTTVERRRGEKEQVTKEGGGGGCVLTDEQPGL